MNIRAVGQWMGNHKFWSSVIILFVVGTVLGLFNLLTRISHIKLRLRHIAMVK